MTREAKAGVFGITLQHLRFCFKNKINLQVSGCVYSFESLCVEYEGPEPSKLIWPGLLWGRFSEILCISIKCRAGR